MQKVRDHCHYTGKYRGAAHSICNLRYKISKEIPAVFHNGSTYDYHFIIKQLAREFKGNFECLGENTEKYITFSVPIKKEHDNGKPSIYRLKFIDSYRFMQDSLSNLVNNLSSVDNKEPKNKFIDNVRSMTDSLSESNDKVSKIDKKISQNKFIDNMRSMIFSLTQSIDKVSEIDRKISQIDKNEPDNTFTDSMRSMINSLSQSINKISEIDNDISQIDNKFTGNTRSMISSLSQSIDKISEINNKISYDELIKKFPNTYQLCNNDHNKFELLLRKGVYPYEYMDSWKRFKEESLPDKESFYSELNNEHITDEDYAHAQKVQGKFNIKNLGEYHDFYVQSDTTLLADVFESFRDKCIEIYDLDPAHFLSAPGLARQACLRKTNVELELLTDNDKLILHEEGIRGGICQAIYRYAKANNKYMKNYDRNIESSFLEYLDAHNLYGWPMCKKLPVSDFKWVDDLSIFTEDFIKTYNGNSDKGYTFEVNVEYPKNIHKLHSDLPFLPQILKINEDSKPFCNVRDKENYVIHILTLKQAFNHGLKLAKVHRVIEFTQEAWLKPYIDMNNELHINAKNEFEKNFFKLMNNAVFGKTMENIRNHRDIKLVPTNKRRSILASEPNYHSSKRISKDLMIMEMRKVEVKMNEPIYLGQAILDISKTLMYEFWYDYIKPKYGNKARLCYRDTDSLIIYVETDDFYKDIASDVDNWFDTSIYNKNDNRPLEIGKNKKVIGKFEDGPGGKIMTEFCALIAKAYAYKLDDDTEHKKAKGTKKCIVKREITFKNYVDALFNDKIIIRSQQRFRTDHHRVCKEEVNKIALSSNDDKGIQTFDKVTTFLYGTNVFKVCESEMLSKNKWCAN